jgi:hypothetical protein
MGSPSVDYCHVYLAWAHRHGVVGYCTAPACSLLCSCTYLLVSLPQTSGLKCLPYPTVRLNMRIQFPGDLELHLEVMQEGW